MALRTRQWILARPVADGEPLTPAHFELREVALPELAPGEALVRVRLVNIHSNTRLRMVRGATRVGETDGANYACAEVIASRDPVFPEGAIVSCQAGWQEQQIIRSADPLVGHGSATELVKALNRTQSPWTYVFRPALAAMFPADVLMDVFGTSGLAAYFGLRECGPLMPRDCVLVAGATGSVGLLAVQLAKHAGCYVVGLGHGDARRAWVTDTLGADRCLDYRAPDLDAQLAAAFPAGIDVFSDGIGGELTATVAGRLNRHGRLFTFGSAAAFYADRLGDSARQSLRAAFGISPAVDAVLRGKNIKVAAWIVSELYAERLAAEDQLARLCATGALEATTSVVDGFDQLPEAIIGLYRDAPLGKRQVRFVAGV